MTERLLLASRHRAAIDALLQEHLPDVEVWAYGSRVNGRAHDGSDLDLVLRAPDLKEIPIDRLAGFEDALRDSNIPFLVEARDWACLPERFHREIEREYVVLLSQPGNVNPPPRSTWRTIPLSEAAAVNPPAFLQRLLRILRALYQPGTPERRGTVRRRFLQQPECACRQAFRDPCDRRGNGG